MVGFALLSPVVDKHRTPPAAGSMPPLAVQNTWVQGGTIEHSSEGAT